MSQPRFAVVGVGGFVAPRHLQAIKDVGGVVVAALDPHDSVGRLDSFSYDVDFFSEPARFERHLYKLRDDGCGVDWLAVCSPNYLHDSHIRLGFHVGANVICEKPLTLNRWNLAALADAEKQFNRRVFTVLQLRCNPDLETLRKHLRATPGRHEVAITYQTPRGRWYHHSWKADVEKSGGLVTNIGIHLLDMLCWVFGPAHAYKLDVSTPTNVVGELQLDHGWTNVHFDLSIDPALPMRREMRVDGMHIPFDAGFVGSHTEVYRRTLAGGGFGIEDARPAVELAARLRDAKVDDRWWHM